MGGRRDGRGRCAQPPPARSPTVTCRVTTWAQYTRGGRGQGPSLEHTPSTARPKDPSGRPAGAWGAPAAGRRGREQRPGRGAGGASREKARPRTPPRRPFPLPLPPAQRRGDLGTYRATRPLASPRPSGEGPAPVTCPRSLQWLARSGPGGARAKVGAARTASTGRRRRRCHASPPLPVGAPLTPVT